MLKENSGAPSYPELLDRIVTADVQDAFRYFIGLAACSSTLTCHPERKGVLNDFRFFDKAGKQRFAFIINQKSLLFYFRYPAIDSQKYEFEELKKLFDSATSDRVHKAWTVRILCISDAQRLWRFIDCA